MDGAEATLDEAASAPAAASPPPGGPRPPRADPARPGGGSCDDAYPLPAPLVRDAAYEGSRRTERAELHLRFAELAGADQPAIG